MDRRQFIRNLVGLAAVPLLPDIPTPIVPVKSEVQVEVTLKKVLDRYPLIGFAILDNRQVLLGEF